MTTIERMQKVREFLRTGEESVDIVASYLAIVVDKNRPTSMSPLDWASYEAEAETLISIILPEEN